MAEDILHYGGFRIRLNGSGNLIPRFISLDDTRSRTLVSLPITSSPGKEPMRLCNFIAQRSRLELKTVNMDEVMKVNRIIIYVKGMYGTFAE